MTDKKTDQKRKEILKDEALDKVTGGCNPDYVTGTYNPDDPESSPKHPYPKSNSYWEEQ